MHPTSTSSTRTIPHSSSNLPQPDRAHLDLEQTHTRQADGEPPTDEPAQSEHYPLIAQGKVRDIYALDAEHVLLVASDRISAYDWVLPTTIPDKGRILTQLSAWWFEQLADVVPSHLITADPAGIPPQWHGRSMVVRKLDMIPVECIARGYLTGSALAQVRTTGQLEHLHFPPDSPDGLRLNQSLFTPSTKAAVGSHDENITVAQMRATVGHQVAQQVHQLSLDVYERGHDIAIQRGFVLADTKLEFGRLLSHAGGEGTDADDHLGSDCGNPRGTLVLADEVLTPDSSRWWLMPEQGLWSPGSGPPEKLVSFDKQYVRDWLTSPASRWRRDSGQPPPPLPEAVVENTRQRYIEIYERLTGKAFH